MKLKLVDKDNNELDISNIKHAFKISNIDFKNNLQTMSRLKNYGSGIVSDLYFNDRKVSLDFMIAAKNDIDFQTQINSILYFLRARQAPFYIVNDEPLNYRRLKVYPNGLKEKLMTGNEKRYTEYSIDFIAPDGLWETDLVSQNFSGSNNIDVTLPNYCVETYFKILFSNAENRNSLTLINLAIGRSLTISGLPVGIVSIDSTDTGLIMVGGVNYNSKLSNGTFFPLISGLNQIRVYINNVVGSSINTDFTVTYRSRFIM